MPGRAIINGSHHHPCRLVIAVGVCVIVSHVGGIGRSHAVTDVELPHNPARVNPFPRPLVNKRIAVRWEFSRGDDGWRTLNACQLSAEDGQLCVAMTGHDPYLISPAVKVSEPVRLTLRVRCRGSGQGQVYWTTQANPNTSEQRVAHFDLHHDGKWHTLAVDLPVIGTLTHVRLDPGNDRGTMDVDWIELSRPEFHPAELMLVSSDETTIHFVLHNHGDRPLVCRVDNRQAEVPARSSVQLSQSVTDSRAFATVLLRVTFPGHADLPSIERRVSVHRTDADGSSWPTIEHGELSLSLSADGRGGRIFRNGQLVAILQPMVSAHGRPVEMTISRRGSTLVGSGRAVHDFRCSFQANVLRLDVASDEEIEGPVIRVLGGLEQGVLCGVEYLGRGEHSSSTKDIKTAEHVRFRPPPLWITTPLMGFVTDRASVLMQWDSMNLQPVFASPDFLDAMPNHRMGLAGKRISAQVRVGPGWPDGGRLADAFRWHLETRGLPEPPNPVRDRHEQFALCMQAFEGPLRSVSGWGHCVQDRWPRRFYGGIASTIYRITGQLPEAPDIVQGGVHVANPAAYFLSGRARQWLNELSGRAAAARRTQRPDGSHRYSGRFREGHFEDTASGHCALQAIQLLDHAWYTGDRQSLQDGLESLTYMRRFRTPRGAQTWELSLHTPDILASAELVHAYLRGYQITGDEAYLTDARRWALSGIPFVYTWSDRPIMQYATTPVFGATNWKAPNWIGRPVQWCGLSYAYWIAELAQYDDSLDWRRIATGVLRAAEQMQYPEGPSVGCLPDAFDIKGQHRLPADINPCVLVALRLKLAGELDSICVAKNERFRVVAPFPAILDDDAVTIQARAGANYQVVVNGDRIVDVDSRGVDRIELTDGE